MNPRVFCAMGRALLLLGIGLTMNPPADAEAALEPEAKPVSLSFESGGKKIQADLYPAAGGRSLRTVLVLHGAGGILFDGPSMRRVARTLAASGDTVYLLHYFNRTGTIGALDATMQAHFSEWLETVRDAINWAHARDGKNARPIGLYGYSLGGFLSLAAASDNPRVGAVTEQAGGIWNSQEKRLGKMPPVLMVHGLEDQRVPVKKYARPLERVLRARGGQVETDWVPGQGHVFSEAAMSIVRPKVAKFFTRELPSSR
ncbi:MAG: alpha/beta fold hydrolase [Chthoniobacterales bacterium]